MNSSDNKIDMKDITSSVKDKEMININEKFSSNELNIHQGLDFTSIKNLAISKGFENNENRQYIYSMISGINLNQNLNEIEFFDHQIVDGQIEFRRSKFYNQQSIDEDYDKKFNILDRKEGRDSISNWLKINDDQT